MTITQGLYLMAVSGVIAFVGCVVFLPMIMKRINEDEKPHIFRRVV